MNVGTLRPSGTVSMKKVSSVPVVGRSLRAILREGFPWFGQPSEVFRWRLFNCRRLLLPMLKISISNLFNMSYVGGDLYVRKLSADGTSTDYGLASLRLVTRAAVALIIAEFNAAAGIAAWDFHGLGVTNTAEASTQTALASEVAASAYTGDVRATGTPSLPANSGDNYFYRTVATNTIDAGGPFSIVEHGVFTLNAAGTMLDRSIFGTITLENADGLESTYTLTVSAGG